MYFYQIKHIKQYTESSSKVNLRHKNSYYSKAINDSDEIPTYLTDKKNLKIFLERR